MPSLTAQESADAHEGREGIVSGLALVYIVIGVDYSVLAPWLAKNLKAEIDADLIEAYRGTISLPFNIGDYKQIAIKIVDDRGIESLKILYLEG